ncbi:MAG: hypothetical protein GY722_27310 [bacterium]|nr:hypothetical protein [bacterium]
MTSIAVPGTAVLDGYVPAEGEPVDLTTVSTWKLLQKLLQWDLSIAARQPVFPLERNFVERRRDTDVLDGAKGECLHVDPVEWILAGRAAATV